MSRFILCLLLLHLSSCDVLWGGFVPLNPDACHNGGTQCATGYTCNRATTQCEPVSMTCVAAPMQGTTAPMPTLTAVTPPLGPNQGGIQLQLDGQNFQPGATVSVAGGPATQTTFVSPTRLTAMLPSSSRGFGMVPVVVQNPDCQQVSLAGAFAYYASQPFQNLPSQCSSGFRPAANLLADFNKDGKLDLATTSPATNTVNVLLGNGKGGFAAPTNTTVGTSPAGLATGDFNGDLKPDLVVANQGSNSVSVLLGDGMGGFAGARNFGVGMGPVAVGVGDFNGDMKPDLVVANSVSGDASVLFGDGTGGFTVSTVTGLACSLPFSVGVGDFDGDTKTDFILACPGNDQMNLSINNGMGGFTNKQLGTILAMISSVAVGDVNGN